MGLGKIFEDGIGAMFSMAEREEQRNHEVRMAEASRPIINITKIVVINKETGKKLELNKDDYEFVDVEAKVLK